MSGRILFSLFYPKFIFFCKHIGFIAFPSVHKNLS